MSAADFRQISFGQGLRNCERIFRAAISAYCTLDRPTSYETAQLDDLALGLFDAVPADARRFAAAALCDAYPAPPRLVRRLCEEPVEIAAPLLIRSRALSDVDLIALISSHGLAHARVIARRDKLNPVIAALIKALIARAKTAEEISMENSAPSETEAGTLDDIRHRLRELMEEAESHTEGHSAAAAPQTDTSRHEYITLRDCALTGESSRFAAALARALHLQPDRARNLACGVTYSGLLVGLKAMGLTTEEAFLVTAAMFPAQVTHRSAIRIFIDRYESLDPQDALQQVSQWREGDHSSEQGIRAAF